MRCSRLPSATRFQLGETCRITRIGKLPTMFKPAGNLSCSGAPSTALLRNFDLVVLPTHRHISRKIDAAIRRERTDKPLNPEPENTSQFNAYGIPAISVPCGFTSAGLPVELMIAGPRFSEGRVLALANAYERSRE
jgi:Amidase